MTNGTLIKILLLQQKFPKYSYHRSIGNVSWLLKKFKFWNETVFHQVLTPTFWTPHSSCWVILSSQLNLEHKNKQFAGTFHVVYFLWFPKPCNVLFMSYNSQNHVSYFYEAWFLKPSCVLFMSYNCQNHIMYFFTIIPCSFISYNRQNQVMKDEPDISARWPSPTPSASQPGMKHETPKTQHFSKFSSAIKTKQLKHTICPATAQQAKIKTF